MWGVGVVGVVVVGVGGGGGGGWGGGWMGHYEIAETGMYKLDLAFAV